jgi:hypothetical protein
MTGGAAFNEVFLDGVLVPDSDRLDDVGQGVLEEAQRGRRHREHLAFAEKRKPTFDSYRAHVSV